MQGNGYRGGGGLGGGAWRWRHGGIGICGDSASHRLASAWLTWRRIAVGLILLSWLCSLGSETGLS